MEVSGLASLQALTEAPRTELIINDHLHSYNRQITICLLFRVKLQQTIIVTKFVYFVPLLIGCWCSMLELCNIAEWINMNSLTVHHLRCTNKCGWEIATGKLSSKSDSYGNKRLTTDGESLTHSHRILLGFYRNNISTLTAAIPPEFLPATLCTRHACWAST